MEDLVIVTNRRLDRTITKLWEKIKATFPIKDHTHTTDQVKMVDEPTKTLTTELDDMKKLIYAGL